MFLQHAFIWRARQVGQDQVDILGSANFLQALPQSRNVARIDDEVGEAKVDRIRRNTLAPESAI